LQYKKKKNPDRYLFKLAGESSAYSEILVHVPSPTVVSRVHRHTQMNKQQVRRPFNLKDNVDTRRDLFFMNRLIGRFRPGTESSEVLKKP